MASMFGTKQQAAPAPTPTAPAPMPDTNSAGALEAKRRAQADLLRRGGRQSTILTAPADRGGNYTGRALG